MPFLFLSFNISKNSLCIRGIQSTCWFIQNAKQWIMLQGTDDGQLLPISERKLADPSGRIQLQSFTNRSADAFPAVFPAQTPLKAGFRSPSPHIRIENCFRREISCNRQNLFFSLLKYPFQISLHCHGFYVSVPSEYEWLYFSQRHLAR